MEEGQYEEKQGFGSPVDLIDPAPDHPIVLIYFWGSPIPVPASSGDMSRPLADLTLMQTSPLLAGLHGKLLIPSPATSVPLLSGSSARSQPMPPYPSPLPLFPSLLPYSSQHPLLTHRSIFQQRASRCKLGLGC